LQIQRELANNLKFTVLGRMPRLIAGVDSSFFKQGEQEFIITVIVVISFPDLELVEKKFLTNKVHFPYISGLLSFREGPAFIKTWKRLNHEPEVVMFDGQGIAHPRGIGFASHMGLWIDRPTIGIAKSRLYGNEEATPSKKGEWHPIHHPTHPKKIGAIVSTRTDSKPLYISPGNLITLEDSIQLVLSCLTRYRLPEPTRLAHWLTQKVKQDKKVSDPNS